MAELVPAIHVFWRSIEDDVDTRDKPRYDGL
jgi:hypothetical protein